MLNLGEAHSYHIKTGSIWKSNRTDNRLTSNLLELKVFIYLLSRLGVSKVGAGGRRKRQMDREETRGNAVEENKGKKKKQKQTEKRQTESETKPGAKDLKKAEAKAGSKPEGKRSILFYYAVVILGLAVITAGILVLTTPQENTSGKAHILARATVSASDAMDLAEETNHFVILRNQGEIISGNNSKSTIVRFPIEGSDEYRTFDVILDENLELQFIGLNGAMLRPDEFMRSQRTPNTFQSCAKIFNEKAIIPNLIGRWVNGTAIQRHIMTIPKTINCSGTSYPYRLEIGDGFVKTTLNGYYYRHGFRKGIVTNELDIPEEDVRKGVFVYVDRIAPGKLRYSYELRDKSSVTFDEYNPVLIKAYNIESVPRLVWNCKFALARTLASAEQAGEVPQGLEENVLKTLTCMYNNGNPRQLCEPLGVFSNATGDIEVQLPTEYIFSMYETGQESCKPDNDTVLLQVFHRPGSQACEDQRHLLDKLKEEFGDYLELKYYCVDDKDICTKLVGARKE